MSLYLETSCLLKLVLDEPETPRVEALLHGEADIVVTSLARLEAVNVLLGMRFGGQLTVKQHRRALGALDEMLKREPFRESALPGDALERASQQVEIGTVYCRTLVRLHLGAMAALNLRRLVTNDQQQAAAARALGYDVLSPARS